MINNPECVVCGSRRWEDLGRRMFRASDLERADEYTRKRLRVLFEAWIPRALETEFAFDATDDADMRKAVPRLQVGLTRIHSDGEVIIGESAVIKGTVAAETADIAGKIQGDVIIAGAVTLRSDAMIFGTVKAGSMSVEEGAVVQGKILARRSDRPAQDFSNIFNRLPKHDN